MSLQIVDELFECINGYSVKDLFTSAKDKHNYLLKLCKKFLIYNGYKVIDPRKVTYNVKKLDDLIELFYALRDINCPGELTSLYRNDIRMDRRHAKIFVESRQFDGTVGREYALKECTSIIAAFFKYKDAFSLENIGFYLFGTDKFKWVVDSIINKMNNEQRVLKKKKHDDLIKDADAYFEEHERGEYDMFDLEELVGEM